MSDTLDLAQALIQRPSVTPEDHGCQQLMAERLAACGFSIQSLPFAEVENFWAQRGQGPLLVFAGHTDVVPTGPEQQWRYPPFAATIADGYLHGRGAADMKGSLAAMIVAVERFVHDYPDHSGSLGFLITSDEEGPAKNGTVKVVEWLQAQKITMDYCVVGEPSSTAEVGDVVKPGRRGSLGATLTVRGKQGHVAYPHLADNPIHRVAPALADLTQQQWDQGNDLFPATSLQISNIQAGTGATNVIPGECQVVFNFRFSTEVSAEQLQSRTQAILDAHQLDYQLDWQLSGQPFLTQAGALLDATQSAIQQVTGRQTTLSTAGGTSDARFIAPTGTQVVELGPINATIHQVDECVSCADLETLTNIYYHIMLNLLGTRP